MRSASMMSSLKIHVPDIFLFCVTCKVICRNAIVYDTEDRYTYKVEKTQMQ